jgi:hypothetical protein
MKVLHIPLILALFLPAILSISQDSTPNASFGGGEYIANRSSFELTPEQRQSLLSRLLNRIELLKAKKILGDKRKKTTASIELQWPLSSTLSDYGYHAMKYFVDHDPVYGQLRDYMDGTRTYDLPAVPINHRGTDFFLWPFTWHKMNNDEVQIVAAAPGWILDKDDGYFDEVCGENPPLGNLGWWNAVYLYHEDGSMTWYGHMKTGSLTTKDLDEYVEAGEYLGIVGSSGYSWEPHLHFEIHDDFNALVDPYIGPVNPSPVITWATGEQRPYYDSAINKVMTHSSPPDFTIPCPSPAIINDKDDFNPGDSLYVAAYYRDQLAGQESQYRIYRPDDSIFESWNHSIADDHLFASYWYWGWELPSDAPAGTWRFEVIFEGQTYQHQFYVDEPVVLAQTKVFLEGPYNSDGNEMYTSLELNGDLPTTSPYIEDQRSISTIPADITDWVLVQLRASTAGPAVVFRSSLLHKDGRIVTDDGVSGEINLEAVPGDYYIVIKHRNHLPVMSATPVTLTGAGSTLYDFTSGSEQFYGSGGAKELESAVWGMYGGNADNVNTIINIWDYVTIRGELAQSGYLLGDTDLSGVANIWDYIVTRSNLAVSSSVP